MAPAGFVAAPSGQVMAMNAPAGMMATSVSDVPVGRARAAIGIDWVRVPFPIPRLYAIPTVPEVTYQTTQATGYAFAPTSYVAQPTQMMAQTGFVAQPAPVVPSTNYVVQSAPALQVQQPLYAQVPTVNQMVVPNTPPPSTGFVLVPNPPSTPAGFNVSPSSMQGGMECRVVCTPTGAPVPSPAPANSELEALRSQLQALEAMLPPRSGTGAPAPACAPR